MDFVTYESRDADAIGIKLLVLSLQRHEPTSKLWFVAKEGQDDLVAWLKTRPNTEVISGFDPGATGWNIKPSIMLHFLDLGFKRPTWIDSDIILYAPIRHYFDGAPDDLFILTQERETASVAGMLARTRALNLEPGNRRQDPTINSCILSLTECHRALLKAWLKLTNNPDFIEAQAKPFDQRPFHYAGGQGLLAALLASKEFDAVSIRLLMSGADIAHCHTNDSFSLRDRLANFWKGAPPLVHAQGRKPWRSHAQGMMSIALHPYRFVAKQYLGALPDDELQWTDWSDDPWVVRLSIALFRGNASMSGFLVTAASILRQSLKRSARRRSSP